MSVCKICNEDLYKKITFSNIFQFGYTVHSDCINNLLINSDRIAFPIDGNIVYYDYIFKDIKSTYNIEYLESEYFQYIFTRNTKEIDWSIIIFYERGLFDDFSEDDKLILFSLANTPILIVSLIYYDLSSFF